MTSNEKDKYFKQVSVKGNEVVVQSNVLIDSFKRSGLRELKLFTFLISKVNPLEPDNMRFRVDVRDITKAIGVESTATVYRDVRNIVQNLMEKIVSIYEIEDGKRIVTDVPLLSYAQYHIDEGYADIEISPYLSRYVVNLHHEFTQYRLSNVMYLSSIYAMRIYEMLKKQEKIGTRSFLLDDLRKKLGVSNKFKAYKDFRMYVIDIAQREINNKTDLQISYTPKKSGKKVVAIEFDIRNKNEQTKAEIAYKNPDICSMNVQKLLDFGFTVKDVVVMLEPLTNDEATDAITAVEEQLRKGKTKNAKALIRTALKEKWKRNVKSEKNSQSSHEKISESSEYKIEPNSVNLTKGRRGGLTKIGDLLSDFFGSRKTK